MNILKNYIFYSTFIIWMISEAILYSITKFNFFKTKTSKNSSDSGSATVLTLGITFCITISFIIKKYSHTVLPDAFFYIGILLMVTGIILRWCAVFTLRKYFSYSVQIKDEHKIIKSRLYKHLRHPAYTGFILLLIGIPLSLKLLAGTFLVSIIAVSIFIFRIYIEEKELIRNFGDEYSIYCKNAWRIIPFIW